MRFIHKYVIKMFSFDFVVKNRVDICILQTFTFISITTTTIKNNCMIEWVLYTSITNYIFKNDFNHLVQK